MRKLIHLLTGLFLLAVLVLSLVFLRANSSPVSLTFGRWVSNEQSLGLWIVSAFVLGCAMGLLVGLRLFTSLLNKVEISRLRNKLAKLEKVQTGQENQSK